MLGRLWNGRKKCAAADDGDDADRIVISDAMVHAGLSIKRPAVSSHDEREGDPTAEEIREFAMKGNVVEIAVASSRSAFGGS